MDVSSRIQTLIFSGLFICIPTAIFLFLLSVTCFVCLLLEQCCLSIRLSFSISKLRIWFARSCVSSAIVLFCLHLSLRVSIEIHAFLGNGIRFCLTNLKIFPILTMLVIGIAIREGSNIMFIWYRIWSIFFNQDHKSITTAPYSPLIVLINRSNISPESDPPFESLDSPEKLSSPIASHCSAPSSVYRCSPRLLYLYIRRNR